MIMQILGLKCEGPLYTVPFLLLTWPQMPKV